MQDTSWFIPYLEKADAGQLRNMLVHVTQQLSDAELNIAFASEREQYEQEKAEGFNANVQR